MSLTKFAATLFLTLGATVAGAAGFSSLEERMNGQEFAGAGLEKLSPDELARLNEWLRAHWPSQAAATPYPATADTRGLTELNASRDAIVSTLQGEFTGWSSRSVFELENGMVWEPAGGSITPLSTRPIQNPTVIIEPGMLGTWLLRIEGYNAKMRVKRVR